jgi:hypothetical protein
MIPQLTLAEEVDIILNDAFQGDKVAEETCLQYLFNSHGLVSSEMSEEEIQEAILEHEDQIYYIYELYSHDEL